MPWNEIVNFTPLSGLAGGILLGLGAALLLLANGRIAGFSGIISNLNGSNRGWRIAFLAGVVFAGTTLHTVMDFSPPEINTSPLGLIAAGLLVGFGTRLGNGCTSGHGICGLSRLSARSLAAVMVFMATAMMTVFISGQF